MNNKSIICNSEYSDAGEAICYICGRPIHLIPFKNGFICETCLQYVKSI